MSSINVDTLKSRLGGPPTLPSGVVVSAAATFSNDVSIGGTLTYEDVTNVDAVGLITARSGIKFGAAGIGGTIAANGNTTLAGVVTASQFVGDGSGLTNLVGTGVTNNVNTVNLNVISGISTFGGDVSIADKIIHTGDTNTAIRFPTADTITAETAGSEVIRITSDGDIGIDQSTPRSRLDVFESTTGDQTAIRVGNTNTPSSANDKRIEFVDGTGTTEGTNKFTYGYIQGLRAGGANSGDLIFGTKRSNGAAPVEAMRLDDSGYLGIGTAIPESELHVMESKSGGSSHASSQLTLERDGTNYLQFMTANNGTSGLLFGDVADNDGTAIKYDHNTSLMLFNTEASERLRIGSAGQIGIAGANYGTSGQVLTSGGGSAAPSWTTPAAGAWTLLQSASNPNTSAVDFVGLTTTYAAYKVQFMGANINSSNSRNMRCKVYLNGALQSGNNYRIMSQYTAIGNNTSYGYGGTWTSIPLSGQYNSNSRGYNGEITFPMKLRTSGSVESLQAFYGTCVSEEFGNTIRGYCEGSYSNLLTGIRFDSPDNYNVTDGQFYLYGLTRT